MSPVGGFAVCAFSSLFSDHSVKALGRIQIGTREQAVQFILDRVAQIGGVGAGSGGFGENCKGGDEPDSNSPTAGESTSKVSTGFQVPLDLAAKSNSDIELCVASLIAG